MDVGVDIWMWVDMGIALIHACVSAIGSGVRLDVWVWVWRNGCSCGGGRIDVGFDMWMWTLVWVREYICVWEEVFEYGYGCG